MSRNSAKNSPKKLLYKLLYFDDKTVVIMVFWGILQNIKTLRKPLNHAD